MASGGAPKRVDDFSDALVGAGDATEEADGQDENVLGYGEPAEGRVLPADDYLDDRREDQGQGGAAHRAHQRDEQAQFGNRLRHHDCNQRLAR